MSDIVILGAGKFSLVAASYVQAAEPHAVIRRLALEGEETAPGLPVSPFDAAQLDPSCRYVLGVADSAARRRLLDALASHAGLDFPNFIHPAAHVPAGMLQGASRGNLFGLNCYVGVAVEMGSFNVVNYHCCIGNHSRIGDNNFFSPQFNSGNSVQVGNDCYFGLGVNLTPGTEILDGVTVQAGVTVSEALPAHVHVVSTARQKMMQLNQPTATLV